MKNRFKDIVDKTKKIYGTAFGAYPVTMVMIIITMVLACVYDVLSEGHNRFYNTHADNVMVWWLLFCVYGTVGFFGVEAFAKKFFEKNGKLKKISGFLVVLALSGLLVSVSTEKNCFGNTIQSFRNIGDNYLVAWNMAYFVTIILSVFYCRYKESEQSIEKFFVSVFTQIVQLSIVWGLLAVGFLILSLIFKELITDFPGVYAVPQILIIGLYVAPRFLMAMTDFKEEIGRFFEALIKYAMLILTIIGAVIIYLYIIKALFTGIPSNEIFGITTGLFFAAIPVGFACTAFPKDSLLQKIAYILPFVYAPFILLQGYSLFVRIDEYGVTPSRYMGIVLIVLEIVYTVVYAFKRKHIDKVVLVMMAVTLVVCLVPGINVNTVSISSQRNIIVKAVKAGLPTDAEGKKAISGAYEYLVREYGEDCIDKFISQSDKKKIENIDDSGVKENQSYVYYGLSDNECVAPVCGFDYFTRFDSINYDYESKIDVTQISIRVDSYEIGTFDLTKAYNNLKQRCEENDTKYVYVYDEVDLSSDCRLIITSETIREAEDTGDILEYSVSGYILFRESYFERNPQDIVIFEE